MLSTIPIQGLFKEPSRIVLGTMNFGDTVDAAGSEAIIERALEQGINHVDTANGYALGTTEALIGPILKPYREQIVLATKVGMSPKDSGGLPLLSPKAMRLSLEGSLTRLETDVIDIYYLHQPDRSTPVEETLAALKAFMDEGKIRSWAVSNYAAWQVAELVHRGWDIGLPTPVFAQNAYSLLSRRVEDEFLEFSRVYGVGFMAYNPLAGGLLVTEPEAELPERFTTSSLAGMYQERYGNEAVTRARQRISRIASEAGMTMIEASLRWLISQPGVESVLFGANTTAHVTQNIELLTRGSLPQDMVLALDEATTDLKGHMAAYNR